MGAFVEEQTEAVSWFLAAAPPHAAALTPLKALQAGGLPSPRGHDTCEELCCVQLALVSSSWLWGKEVGGCLTCALTLHRKLCWFYTHFLSLQTGFTR